MEDLISLGTYFHGGPNFMEDLIKSHTYDKSYNAWCTHAYAMATFVIYRITLMANSDTTIRIPYLHSALIQEYFLKKWENSMTARPSPLSFAGCLDIG